MGCIIERYPAFVHYLEFKVRYAWRGRKTWSESFRNAPSNLPSQRDPQYFIYLSWYVVVLICRNPAQRGPESIPPYGLQNLGGNRLVSCAIRRGEDSLESLAFYWPNYTAKVRFSSFSLHLNLIHPLTAVSRFNSPSSWIHSTPTYRQL